MPAIILNLAIMFGFWYFAARGVRSWFHHLSLMKYHYSKGYRDLPEDIVPPKKLKRVFGFRK